MGDGRGSCGQTAAYARASDAAWSSAEAQSTRRFAGRISNPFGALYRYMSASVPFLEFVACRRVEKMRGVCAPFMCVIVDTN